MADTVTCPVCGEPNPPEAEICRNCESRLRPLPQGIGGEPVPLKRDDVQPEEDPGSLEEMLPTWLREARQQARQEASKPSAEMDSSEPEGPKAEAADLLAGLEMQAEQSEADTPDWVARIAGKPSKSGKPEAPKTKQIELGDADEGAKLGAAPSTAQDPERKAEPAGTDPFGAWFKKASGATQPNAADNSVPPSRLQRSEAQTVPDKPAESPDLARPPAQESPAMPELPAWLQDLGTQPASNDTPSAAESIPAWLGAEPATALPDSTERLEAPHDAGLPDWVASLNRAQGETPDDAPAGAPVPSASPLAARPFRADSLSNLDLDEIFASMQTPDWLEEATRASAAASEAGPPAAQEQGQIAPANLPSWVEAMRPVDSEVPAAPALPVDTRVEEGGPLDGLQGVLPAIPGAGAATGKPQTVSAKLDASEQQRGQAELLEKMLAAEVTPIPMKAVPLVGAQRTLRWALTSVLILMLGAVLFSGSRVFTFPTLVPIESFRAVQAIGAIPAGAPVLLVFDYQPATVGEMEASGSGLLDHLLLLQHPQLALISTSPTGAALAERFISTTLSARQYQLGQQYVDLGYLPGGLAGIRAFAQDPAGTIPLGADANPVWNSEALRPVRSLSDFAAIIVLTDSVESGRTWIEQTAGIRGSQPLVMVTSAQAGPMLLPYVDSTQVTGLISGVYGAVGAEQANGGLPGLVRRYWDAYNVGLYLAAVLIVFGAIWNLGRGLQDQRAARAGQ